MRKLKTYFAFIFSIFCFVACKDTSLDTTINLQSYYFPFQKLKQGQVYEYINDSTGTIDYFWHYQSMQDDKGNWFLISAKYTPKIELEQKVTERIYKEGVTCELYEFYLKDAATESIKTTKMQLIETVTYPFEIMRDTTPNTGSVYRFKAKYTIPQEPNVNFTTNKDRKFVGLTEENINNKKTSCAIFDIQQYTEISDTVNGGYWTMDNIQIRDIYAEEIGLVKSIMKMKDGIPTSHTLNNRYTFQEFESKYKTTHK